jgi:hypothetical protein
MNLRAEFRAWVVICVVGADGKDARSSSESKSGVRELKGDESRLIWGRVVRSISRGSRGSLMLFVVHWFERCQEHWRVVRGVSIDG